ncbi:tyrosine-type recombinase/integrase [Mucilaginibacter gotjawali]|uniref:Tyrosine recombinase XerC n=2 Tax=Mucilaginibacter gotjawali TaxID=1550579 RepID=A0A120MYM9_9SPHI|nr:tyrosine-type recombinase/integrase [Mucilaginibacter gotjawali]MBB3057443.1 integrase/recombinase XerC [Mucilaginibacter gotjawali]BAU55437.1 Tyrosine recombinase XerC [Mucilaginibacter gotjawali]
MYIHHSDVQVVFMFTERFIRYIQFEKRYSPHTVSAYQSDLDQFTGFLNNPQKLSPPPPPVITHPSQITHYHIRNWMVELMNQHIIARSINRKIATLRKYFKFLLQEGVIEINPASKINTPKIPKNLPVIVEDVKLTQMLDDNEVFGTDFKGLRDKLVIEMLFGTGMRLSELMGVKDSDINEYEGTIKVLGKRNKERIIPVNNELKLLIAEYQELKKKQDFFGNNSLTLIVTDKGANAYAKLIYLIVQKYLSYISTQNKRSPHVLRHTFATSLLNRGADLNAIKELLGHANLSATQIYTHNSVERLKSIYKQAHPKA